MKRRNKFRWHYVYYLLAAFDIITITASLMLSHQTTDIFNDSVSINTVWAGRASSITTLNQLVTKANAPGNDVFENGDIEGERKRFNRTLKDFLSSYSDTRNEIDENVSINKHDFLEKLDESYLAFEQLVDEARAVFLSIENGNTQNAGRHMATMDRHYAVSSLLLGEILNLIIERQQKLFSEQLKSAAFYRQFEIIFALIVGVIIIFVTLYGHVIAKRFRELELEREASISEVNFIRFSIDEHAIVSVTDVKGDITFVNEKFCSVSGYSREELIGRNHRIIKSEEQTDEFWMNMWRTVASGEVWNGEIKNTNKSGGHYWVETTIIPRINEFGKPFEYVGIRTEITKQKQIEYQLKHSEERHSLLIQTQTDLICRFTPDGVLNFINDAYAKFVGKEPELIIGTSIYDDVPPSEHQEMKEYFSKLTRKNPSASIQNKNTSDDGTIRTFDWVNHAYFDQSGNVTEIQSVGRDVTELLQSRKDANAANEAKSEFLASMSHEIRTPMTGVIGFADLLLKDNLDAESKDKVFKIKDASSSLLRIINEILDLSKMEAGKMEIEHIDIHFPSLVDDALSLFDEKRKDGRAKSLTLSKTLSDELPVGINSDPTRLRQILINLIGNAVKFTEKGSVTVGGSLLRSGKGDFIRIEIKDTGVGIKPEVIGKLFSDFTQADNSISRRYEGTGLGLSICKRLVELMGGEIGVDSDYGKGSTFWFTLPYTPVTSEVSANNRTTTVTHFQTTRSLHILIVDDNDFNQQIITANMGGLEHTTNIADNGMMAVEMHEANYYDLILMDIRMPVLSGPEATELIRQMDGEKAKIPIIALTADVTEDHIKTYLKVGMDAVAAKPIDLSELVLAINTVMDEEIHVGFEVEVEATEPVKSEASNTEPDSDIDDFLAQLQAVADKHDDEKS